MGLICSQHMNMLGKKLQFLKRIFKRLLRRMRLYLHIKLSRNKLAFQQIAFQFGNVNPVGAKPPKALYNAAGIFWL